MDQIERKIQPSFIPKRNTGGGGSVARAKRPTTIFYWVGLFIFIVSLILSAGVFVYGRFVITKQLENRKQAIKNEIEAFDTELTGTLTLIKSRIDSGEDLLSKHISASPVLFLLEDITAKNVYFKSLSFSALPNAPAMIEASGETSSYASLAFQSEVFSQSEFILNPVFSGLKVNDKGKVEFNVEAVVSPKLIHNQKPTQEEPSSASGEGEEGIDKEAEEETS